MKIPDVPNNLVLMVYRTPGSNYYKATLGLFAGLLESETVHTKIMTLYQLHVSELLSRSECSDKVLLCMHLYQGMCVEEID